jgi:hypothetical protein
MGLLFTNYLKPRTRVPRVWDCHAGKVYPADAIYVGCRTTHPFKGYVIREGTIFGNGADPLVSHQGALHTESEFRAYAIEKLKDPGFLAEAEKLHGKDLLCWCVQKGKRWAEFCHARVWLELINNGQGELPSIGLSTEQRRDFDWGHYEPNFLSKEEADALFEMVKVQPRHRPIIKRSGYQLRRCASTTWSVRDRHAEDSDLMVPLAEAPPELISLQRKLSDLAGKEVNYFSLQAYENGRDHIGFHQHREISAEMPEYSSSRWGSAEVLVSISCVRIACCVTRATNAGAIPVALSVTVAKSAAPRRNIGELAW